MTISGLLCGRGKVMNRTHNTTRARNSEQAEPHVRAHILHGVQGPENTIVEVPASMLLGSPREAPSYSIQSLSRYMRERRNKLPPIFRTRTTKREHGEGNKSSEELRSSLAPQKHDDNAMGSQKSLRSVTVETSLVPISSSQMVRHSQELAPRSLTKDLTTESNESATLLADPEVIGNSRNNRVDLRGALEQGTILIASRLPTQNAAQTNSASTSTAPSAPGSSKSFVPSPLRDPSQASWMGAAMVKAPKGEPQARHIFYDSGSTDNMITTALASSIGLEYRPILPKDLKVYGGANHSFIPKYYVQLELKDDGHGIKEYTKVSFNVADTLGGWSLLVGRTFMSEHNLGLARVSDPQSLVLTARAASKEEKRKQQQWIEETKKKAKIRQDSQNNGSTTAGSSTSRGHHTIASSCTTVPSSGTTSTSKSK
ncbi:hypothetical protein GLAREA_09669 [Glarea lozoyensis ATCC 20868]|uniref:Uncharacterized protein n=1 Tax=Glarea lozoyensis (strain ATCC 20868 / MF5171) TaxID=1116229 RepID=S3DPZ1_GLAL2|nr:uncharacterized protein GLAREA_09669 [Glarea lozoyensis ATCC 20868]EPE28548.1 hypothetical protein GLAREA_09669 [Glarea lozoyensis ATCC 20868]